MLFLYHEKQRKLALDLAAIAIKCRARAETIAMAQKSGQQFKATPEERIEFLKEIEELAKDLSNRVNKGLL